MNFEVLKKNVEQAVRTSISKFADFTGRASRPEYWYLMLPVIALLVVANLIDSILFGTSALSLVVALATLVPTLSAGARRLHDTGRPGWWLLVAIIPIVGGLYVIYLCCQPGTSGPNQFGPEPSSASYGALAQA
ncbi:DUF805 domain-containing protein [Microvirga mediterraneensis]|uniref:DUF805 domain-containing protein n=1 Tax=Microvirga mediterraneensis TaxID=2754695 RepID=A0A838BQG7_9HYPH|nr:DUF805 domain-containing protein [Microvirga mediterraneensis]MBA1156686.1 DUF805 domain-containing protein [Microvirga mediterraneensis]